MRCTTKMRIMEILRLWEMDLTQREIANSVKCGKTTVGEIQDRCINAGLTYDQASHLTNNEIRALLYPDSFGKKSCAPDPPWKDIHKVLQSRDNRKNMRYIWMQDYACSMSYSQFCRRYIDSNSTEDLYRYLLLTQCNALNKALPMMFERMGSYTEMLLPNNILHQGSVIGRMVTDIPAEDWLDAVQIIGWLYQFYNKELKDETFKLDPETLITGDIFPCINESILNRLFTEISNRVVKTDLIMIVTDNRRTAAWYDRYREYYTCLYNTGKMQVFFQQYAEGFHIVEPKKIWKLYTNELYRMDQYYRRFHVSFVNALNNVNERLEDNLKHTAEYVDTLYQNHFLNHLTTCWTNAISDDLQRLGYVSEIEKQRDFYQTLVLTASGKNTRVFVIVSDALRFEVAAELSEALPRETNGKTELSSMQSAFPSITKFGMASLLPGRSLSVNKKMEVFVDGLPTKSTADREAILNSAPRSSAAVQYKDFKMMKQNERRELVTGKDVIYIYHNTIDAVGDKATTETNVFDACNAAIQDLKNIVRIVTNELSGTNILITADHGFLYTYQPLAESDKLDRKAFNGEIFELGRRYALVDPDTAADHLLPIKLDQQIQGVAVKGYTPRETIRMKIQGGGANYVHGGISLQELVVPVILFKNIRTSNKKYIEATNTELKLLSESRKVSNLIFSLDFLQPQPVSEKMRPCTYAIHMTDDEGVIVSDTHTVIADKSSDNAADRVFRTRFNLKAKPYDKSKIYLLVIANGIDIPNEVEFHIDIAFADDFGFNL